ncbi:MAG: SRPBCC family protein [Chitinophagaceae bacterium]|nr:SRPBCC family protein [Chitinophagaceae bacterium]
MPTIHLTTFIEAPQNVVFDLSRHIGLHKISQQQHKEEAVSGTTSGLIQEGGSVTWKAKHLFKTRFLTIKISQMQTPSFFEDVMEKGDFKLFEHEHHFKPAQNGTIVIDILRFESPYGVIGKLFNTVYLSRYLKQLIEQRNKTIREYAESKKWEALLNP